MEVRRKHGSNDGGGGGRVMGLKRQEAARVGAVTGERG